jgi:hypothetical protein
MLELAFGANLQQRFATWTLKQPQSQISTAVTTTPSFATSSEQCISQNTHNTQNNIAINKETMTGIYVPDEQYSGAMMTKRPFSSEGGPDKEVHDTSGFQQLSKWIALCSHGHEL